MLEKSLKTRKSQNDAIFFLLFCACSKGLVGGLQEESLGAVHPPELHTWSEWPTLHIMAPLEDRCRAGTAVWAIKERGQTAFLCHYLAFPCSPGAFDLKIAISQHKYCNLVRYQSKCLHSANTRNNWVSFQCQEGKSQGQPSVLLTNKIWIDTQERLGNWFFLTTDSPEAAIWWGKAILSYLGVICQMVEEGSWTLFSL